MAENIPSKLTLPHSVSTKYEIALNLVQQQKGKRDSPTVYKGKFVINSPLRFANGGNTREEEVAVRVFEKSKQQENNYGDSSRALELLMRPMHENIIRLVHKIDEESFVFIATELCELSVGDLFNTSDKTIVEIKQKLGAAEILRQSTEGLTFLHDAGFFHCNLKPAKFRIAQYALVNPLYQVKLCDFRFALEMKKNHKNSLAKKDEWIAPEVAGNADVIDSSVDVFLMGLYFHYVLFGGKHPFNHKDLTEIPKRIGKEDDMFYKWVKGDTPMTQKKKDKLMASYKTCWAGTTGYKEEEADVVVKNGLKLIRKMAQFTQEKRIPMKGVLSDAFFTSGAQDSYEIYDSNDGRKPGLCVIFCQTKFKQNTSLEGDEITGGTLGSTFEQLGFEALLFDNQDAKTIFQILKYVAKNEMGKYNSLVVCFLSHGLNGSVIDVNDEKISIYKLQMIFNSRSCPALHGKPKIFLIDACRNFGKRDETQNAKAATENEKALKVGNQKDESNVSPVSDIFYMATAFEGTAAYSGDGGSRYTLRLCEKLTAGKIDEPINFEDVITEVQKEICGITREVEEDKQTKYEVQTPQHMSSCRKRIVFQKKVQVSSE